MTLDFLPAEDLSRSERDLFVALTELPRLTANLQELRSGLARVSALLNFEPADRPPTGLSGRVADAVTARVVATRNEFDVVHIHLPRFRAAAERPAVEQISRAQPHCLVVATSAHDEDRGAWHFINVKDAPRGKRLFRRVVVDPSFVGRTVIETLSACAVRAEQTGLEIQKAHEDAFNVEAVSREFYRSYARHYERLRASYERLRSLGREEAERRVQELLNRLVFLSFIQRKDWLGRDAPDRNYLWNEFRRSHRPHPSEHTYHRDFLVPLFQALSMREGSPGRARLEEAVGRVPFLNGGLFEAEDSVEQFTLPNQDFEFLFEDLLLRYNFTVREDTPLDQEVAVDPEMLGRVFESIVLERERQRDIDLRKSTGSYYTPRQVVHFLCQQALLGWLGNAASASREALAILSDVQGSERFGDEEVERLAEVLSVAQAQDLRERLRSVLVVDPAVGSGAFLLAILHEILALVRVLDARIHGSDSVARENYDYDLKSHLIQHNLYGVDIQERAIRICELRLWLSLVVDYQGTDVPPLPNLTYRLRVGDSLIEHLFGLPFNLEWAAGTDRGRRIVDEYAALKDSHTLATDMREKRRLELGIIEKQCDLAELAITERRESIGADVPLQGLGAPSPGQEAVRETLAGFGRLLGRARTVREEARRVLSRARAPTEAEVKAVADQMGFSFVWRLDFAEVWRNKGGFDIAVANPPYVRIQTLSKEDVQRYRSLFRSATRNYDIYVLFDEATYGLLNHDGIMAFIHSNKFLIADYGEGLRSWIAARRAPRLLVDFGNVQIFDATIYTCLLFLSPRPGDAFQYARLDRGGREDAFRALAEWTEGAEVIQNIPTERIGEAAWLLDRPEATTVWNRLLAERLPLSHVADRIFQGVITGADPVYILEAVAEDDVTVTASSRALGSEVTLERGAVRPLLKGADIRRYAVRGGRHWLIWPYDLRDGVAELRPAAVFQEEYPLAWTYIRRNEEWLRGRERGRMEHPGWYGFSRVQNLVQFDRRKILVQVLARRAALSADSHGTFYFVGGATAGGNGIVLREDTGLDLFYLLALLNSRPLDAYLQSYASRFQNGYYSYGRQSLQRLPIAIGSPSVQTELAAKARELQRLHTDLLRDPSVAAQSRLRELEIEVDRQVYELYGLDDRDIAVIEERIPLEPELTEEYGRLLSYGEEDSDA